MIGVMFEAKGCNILTVCHCQDQPPSFGVKLVVSYGKVQERLLGSKVRHGRQKEKEQESSLEFEHLNCGHTNSGKLK